MIDALVANPSAALVRRMIATQFPAWSALPLRPVVAQGWDNRTFHLGEEMLVRLPRAECYAAQVEKEQFWLPKLLPHLPLPIPEPLAVGEPGEGYPWRWSVYRWLPGVVATKALPCDRPAFGRDLASFLAALQRIDASSGPPAGDHNFYRGGALAEYDGQTRRAIDALGDTPDATTAATIWKLALATTWRRRPVWVHGDFAPGNLLVTGGRLSAVIDFGCLGVGDPACDLAIAWTFLRGEGRSAFRSGVGADEGTWQRGRGWALWKALILATGLAKGHATDVANSRTMLREILTVD